MFQCEVFRSGVTRVPKLIPVLLIFVLGACAGSANQPRPNPVVVSKGVQQIAEQEGEVTEEDDRVQCRLEHQLGSNRRHRVCRTVAEWRQLSEESQDFMLEHGRSGCTGCGTGRGGP